MFITSKVCDWGSDKVVKIYNGNGSLGTKILKSFGIGVLGGSVCAIEALTLVVASVAAVGAIADKLKK